MEQAVLVVSFGSSYEETIVKTIQKIEEDIEAAAGEWKIYRAFTSKRIIDSLNQKGIQIDDVRQAVKRMQSDGIKRLLVQPTFITKGIEYERMCSIIEDYRGRFEFIKIGTPLLTTVEDYFKTIEAFTDSLGCIDEDEAVVAMGHGAEHFMSVSYAALDYMFKDRGYSNIYVATIGSYPGIDSAIRQLKEKKYKKVRLVPFMIVSGYHVQKSLIEKSEESWERQLLSEGFKVKLQLRGLGENKAVRAIYVAHTMQLIKEK